jgi:hypothetical protein
MREYWKSAAIKLTDFLSVADGAEAFAVGCEAKDGQLLVRPANWLTRAASSP